MLSELRAGPIQALDGSVNPARAAKTGEITVSDAHGRYHEAVSRGRCFHASMQAGASLGTALTGTAVTLTLYNPTSSGILVSLLETTVAITTDLAAAAATTAVFALAVNVNPIAAAPATNTAATIRNCLLGGAAGQALAYTATTLPAAPVVARVIGMSSMTQASAAGVAKSVGMIVDCTDGKLILAPNTAVTLQSIGTAISGIVSMMWEEVTLV